MPHPGGGFGAWWNTLWSAFARSWKQLLPIVAITSALPGIILAIVGVELLSRGFTVVDNGETGDVTAHWGVFGAFVGLAVALGIVALFAAAIGWSGAMWLVTRQAAGAPASVGEALAFGARRCLRLGGLLVVVGLMVAVGLVACFLPGLYLAVAASLVVPFVIFDRGTSAIGGSFRLVNRNFGAVLGRLADHVSARRRSLRRGQPDRFDDRRRLDDDHNRGEPARRPARSSARPCSAPSCPYRRPSS